MSANTHHKDQGTAQSNWVQKTFLQHPGSVGETYGQHFAFALRFSGRLAVAAGAAFVHALVPSLCEKTAGRMVRELHAMIEHR